jgi:hypothetical protein
MTDGDWTLAPKWAALLAKHEPSAIALASAHKRWREGLAGIVAELRREVTTNTPERHYLETHDAAQRFLSVAAKETQSARESAERRLHELDGQISAKMRCTDDSYTDKLRDRIYAMKPADRQTFATKAIEAGDRAKMAAILNGDALLCGFSDDQKEALRKVAMQKHAGEEIETKNNLLFAKDVVFRTMNDALVAIGTLFPEERVRQLQNETAEIAAARSRLLA